MDRRLKKRVVRMQAFKPPGETALKRHTASAAEKIAARAGDVEGLRAAISARLEAEGEFSAWYRSHFPSVREAGGPGRGKTSARSGGGFSDAEGICRKYGFAQRTVQRWRRLEDEGVRERELAIRLEKADRLVSMAGGAHVGNASGVNEWYTPKEIIEAARDVMGGIDLDPASHAEANEVVGAGRFFSAEEDGLLPEWFGRVWMNPPYAQPLIDLFCTKVVREFQAGRVEQAITLTNNATETAWAQGLLLAASGVCFPVGRIRFWAPGRDAATPLQGQMICYFGHNARAFWDRFQGLGDAWMRISAENSGADAGATGI